MYDLIGFWTVVTLITGAVLAPVTVLFYYASDFVLYRASRERFNLEEVVAAKLITCERDLYWQVRKLRDKAAVTLMCTVVGLFLSSMLSCIVLDKNNVPVPSSLVEGVASLATILAPFFGVVGMIGTAYVLLFVVARKLFDIGYAVKEKLAKIEGNK